MSRFTVTTVVTDSQYLGSPFVTTTFQETEGQGRVESPALLCPIGRLWGRPSLFVVCRLRGRVENTPAQEGWACSAVGSTR